MKKNKTLTLYLAILPFILGAWAWADEVESDINAALSNYKTREYIKAIRSLEGASQKIRRIRTTQIEKIFPKPLSGWTAEKMETNAIGSIFLGEGISAAREYKKCQATVKIEIVSDNPLVTFATGILSTPKVCAKDPGFKIVKIKENNAILDWKEELREGDIKIVIDDRILVTVSGSRCQESDLFAYANSIDYSKVKLDS